MSGFDQRDLTRKNNTSHENAISLDGRPLADAFQILPLSSEERAIYAADQAKTLAQDTSFCDVIVRALAQIGTSAESVALMRIAERGGVGLMALHALINDPSLIDRRLHESGFYKSGLGIKPSDARQEAVATKLTHLVFHLESTSRALSPEDSKVAADILLEVSQNSTFDRARRHALRVLPTVMRGQGRQYEDPVAHERTRGGGLMD